MDLQIGSIGPGFLMNLPVGCFFSPDHYYNCHFGVWCFAFFPGPSSQFWCQRQWHGPYASIWCKQREQVRKEIYSRYKEWHKCKFKVCSRARLKLGCGFSVLKLQSAKCFCLLVDLWLIFIYFFNTRSSVPHMFVFAEYDLVVGAVS